MYTPEPGFFFRAQYRLAVAGLGSHHYYGLDADVNVFACRPLMLEPVPNTSAWESVVKSASQRPVVATVADEEPLESDGPER